MAFWQNLEHVYTGADLAWIVAAFLAVTAALSIADPNARLRARAAVILFGVSLAGLCCAAMLWGFNHDDSAVAYLLLLRIALILQWIAIITVGGMFLFDVLLKAINLRPPELLTDILLAIGYVGAALAVLAHTKMDVSGIVATSAVVTAVIGFSLQDTLGNVMGGMALQLERTIRVGDWIKIDDMTGLVTEIRWRQTSIETRDWDTIVIPNSQLMKSPVRVLGRRRGQPRKERRSVYFNVDFRFSPTDVINAVEAALHDEDLTQVATDPPPHCILSEFSDSYARYGVWYWLSDIAKVEGIDSMVRQRIWIALQRAGIPLSMPAARMFNVNDDDARAQRKAGDEHQRRVAALRTVPLFAPLTDEEVEALAPRLIVTPFAKGEAMTRQGAAADWLYILTRGEAVVRLRHGDTGASHAVATLKAGDFFGEMGLMTGAPRTATVMATTDCSCYRLDKAGLDAILHHRPQIAEDIAALLAKRRVELEAVRENLSEEAKRQRVQRTQGDLLSRIRSFFTLSV